MGDFGNNGFLRFDGGNERVLQHYRSGLNSIPTTEAYMAQPDDTYLLRLAAGSIGGVLTNIEAGTGAPSMGFHGDQACSVACTVTRSITLSVTRPVTRTVTWTVTGLMFVLV